MLCSTIIPTVNRPTLERAVKSALEQDLEPGSHEILVFNNSDKPLPEIDWLNSPKVTIVNTHSNMIDASNKGAAMSSGKYINFLHDDDYLLPGALKALMEIAESSGLSWVHGTHNRIDDDGNFMSVNPQDVQGNIFALLIAGECIHLASSVIRRDMFLKVGGFDPQIRILDDRDLECRIALLSDYARIERLVASVRIGVTGSTADWSLAKQDNRLIRERTLSLPCALARMQESIRGDVFVRGRACRNYLLSAALNLKGSHFLIATGRLSSMLRLAGPYLVLPNFWRGLFFQSHWHAYEKTKEEEHFRSFRLFQQEHEGQAKNSTLAG